MKNINFFKISTLILIFINILMMFVFFNDKKKQKPREIIIEKLKFDEIQIKQYDKTIFVHQNNIKILDDSIRITKNKLYQLLKNDKINVSKKNELINKINSFQTKIENVHFNHFIEIKKLCKKDQLNDFNKLSDELSKLFSPKKMAKKND